MIGHVKTVSQQHAGYPYPDDRGQTHSAGCWRLPRHHNCAVAEVERLDALINSPQTTDFLEAVKTEAAHQLERWGTDHDAGKTDADWFWLVGYLAGKALHKPEKRLHHVITTAAACLNWHQAITGEQP